MKPWRTLAIYLAAVIVFSSLAAPWIHILIRSLGNSSEGLSGLAEVEFRLVLNRTLLLSAILGAVALLRLDHSFNLQTIGFARSPLALKHLLMGTGIAAASVVVVMIIGLGSNALRWEDDRTAGQILSSTIGNLLAAMAIALSEEFFFRGCLLGWLRQRAPAMLALVAVTLFYAICHFMSAPKSAPGFDEVYWYSGFEMLSLYGSRLAEDAAWVQRFIMLVLIGLALGWCFLQTSRLYLSIGLHGGWVFAGKMMTLLTDDNKPESNWWFGYGKIIGSPITIAAVAIVFVLMIWMCRQPVIRGQSQPA